MPRTALAPAYVAPDEHDSSRAVKYWVLNPDAHPGQDALVDAIDKAHVARATFEKKQTVAQGVIGALSVAGIAIAAIDGDFTIAMSFLITGVLACLGVFMWHGPQVQLTAEADVARPVYYGDSVHLRSSQVDTLTAEGFGSPVHRALWDTLVARDAAAELKRAIGDAPHADPDVWAVAYARLWRLRDDQARSYRTFEKLVTKVQIDPDATAALRAAVDRVTT